MNPQATDFAAQQTFIEQDPAVIQALQMHRKRWDDVREADRKVIMEARKVASLMAAFDATIEAQFRQEDVTEEHEKLLKEYTNQDSETWFWRHHQAQELIQEAIAAQCQKVAHAQADYKMLETDHTTCRVLSQAREKAKEKYKAQQAQASKPRRGRPPKNRN
jgi:aspartyl/asparaginyl-tRNA synthetase